MIGCSFSLHLFGHPKKSNDNDSQYVCFVVCIFVNVIINTVIIFSTYEIGVC